MDGFDDIHRFFDEDLSNGMEKIESATSDERFIWFVRMNDER